MIEIVHKLRLARGLNKKLRILEDNKLNYGWQQILKAMYDTSINYHVVAVNDLTFVEGPINTTKLLEDLKVLTNRELTGNAAKDYARSLSQEYGEILRLILGGSLKAGVSVTSINKVYPGLIPEFPLMLAKDVPVQQWPVWCGIKYDGVRLLVRVENGKVEPRTRSGKLLLVRSLIKAFSSMPDSVYDCELVSRDGLQESRTTITGAVNKVLFGTKTDITAYSCIVFDKVSLEEWDAKKCVTPYNSRLLELNEYIKPLGYIRSIEQEVANCTEDLDNIFNGLIAQGYEGLILRYPDDPYVWERSSMLIKKKATYECTLTCTAIQAGKGKYEDKVGALICKGLIGKTHVAVKVGSGLTDYDREQVEDYYLGANIEIMYNSIIKPEISEQHSLFLPRFKRVLNKSDT